MDQYEVIPEAPVLSLNDAAKVPPRKRDPIVDGFGIDETRIVESSPAFDPGKRDPNSFRMAGKHIVDATLNVLLDNPATHLRAIGREYEEDQDPIRKRMEDNLGIPNRRKKIAEKLTALSVAIRDTLDMSPEEMAPRNFFEQVLSGVGGAIPSIGASAAGAMAGGGLATVAKAAPGIVKTAQLAGAGLASFSMEKPVLEKELLDAGFEGGFSDRMSSFYAIPVAMLDAGSFGYLTGVLKPIASEAVSTTVGRSMFRRALQFEASATGQVVVKAAEEGATEAIQGQIQSEFENRLGLQNLDFQRDFSSRVVEFVVGALMGGSFGAAHLGGQLEARSQAIDHLAKVSGQSKSEVARLYDAATLEAIDRTLEDLSKDRGDAVSAQVAERVKWIQQAIDKAMGRTPDLETMAAQTEKAIQPTAEQFSKAQETLMRGETQLVKAKVKEIQAEIRSGQKDVLAAKKELAKTERELRLLKASPLVAFKEAEGRDPRGNELGNWVATRSVSLENKIEALIKRSDRGFQKVQSSRTGLQAAIKDLPDAEGIIKLEDELTRLNSELEKLNVSDDPKSLESAMQISDKITAIEERLAKFGQPEARVKEAEQALDDATEEYTRTDIELEQMELRLQALRSDPLTEFVTEKNRPPKEGELEIWKKDQVTKLTEDISKKKSGVVEQLRKLQILVAEAEAYQLGLEKVTGSLRISSGVIRQQSLSIIRQYQTGFYKGGRLSLKEANGVIRVTQQMIASLPISDKKKVSLLRRVRAVNVEQFNAKLPQFLNTLKEVTAISQIRSLRKAAKDILSDMADAKARNVGAKTQVLAKKLSQILSGDTPASPRLTGKVSTAQIMEQALEEQMASLNSNETDVNAALYAVTALKDFYTGELETRLTQIERIRQDDEKLAQQIIAGLKGGKVNRRKVSVDAVRERLKSTGAYQFLFPSTYLESFLTIANDIDAGQGKPHMEGVMVKNFDPAAAYRAWMTLTHQTREAIDFKLAEIYGPKYLETLTLNRTANFIDVEFINDDGAIEKVNISKASAMSLYMMQRNPAIRQQLIDIGYSEIWLDNLAKGEVFSRQDHQWMTQVDQILQDYGKKIAPLYERLTGKPFRLVDQYFMTQRYMFAEEGKVSDNTPSVVRDMFEGVYETEDITGDPRFNIRVKSARDFVIPDITQAVTRYSSDMNHFLAYAEYAVKLKALLDNKDFMSRIEAEKSKGLTVVLNSFLNNIIDGSDSRSSDRAVMSSQFRALGWLARNKIASPRSGFMQFTALAGFTDPTASTPVNSLEIAQAVLDLPSAIKSGELKNLTDTAYMRERWLGAFDPSAHLSEEMSRSAVFAKTGKFDPKGILRKLGTNKVLHEWMTISTRFGDRAPSVAGGWAVYRKVLAQTGDKVKAVDAAIKMIEEVNGSLDPGKSAEIYGRSDFVSTLFKLFTRSTSIYLDRYLRLHKAGISGRISRDQYVKGLALYHVWIPIFTSSVAMGAGAGFDDDELKTMMLAGPLSYHLFIGAAFKTAAAMVLQATGFNEKFAAGYEQGGDLIDGVSRDLKAAYSKIRGFTEYPDFESMWEAVAYSGKALDFLPLPMGYLSRQPEALMKILQGDWPQGLMEIIGYSSAATKVE